MMITPDTTMMLATAHDVTTADGPTSSSTRSLCVQDSRFKLKALHRKLSLSSTVFIRLDTLRCTHLTATSLARKCQNVALLVPARQQEIVPVPACP